MSPPTRQRRAGVRQTAGLVVEGPTEFLALPQLVRMRVRNCPPLKPINLGGVGSDVTPTAIAKQVLPKVIEHLVANRRPVLVCIDREEREMSSQDLEGEITRILGDLLRTKGRSSSEVHVVAADRTFEAWLLADAEGLHARRIFKNKPTFRSFEGAMGKRDKKGVLELGDLLGRDYAKTTDGPRIFKELDVPVARDHARGARGSRSFDRFLRCLAV